MLVYITVYIVLLVITAFVLKNCLYSDFLEDFILYTLIWLFWPVTLVLWVIWYTRTEYVYVDTNYDEFIERRHGFISGEPDPMVGTDWTLLRCKSGKWLYNSLDTLVLVKVNSKSLIIKEV